MLLEMQNLKSAIMLYSFSDVSISQILMTETCLEQEQL